MASIINSTTTAGVTVTGDNSGSLQLATNNGTTAVTIDTSQNVGIGTSSPNQTGFTSPVLSVSNGTSGVLELIGTQTSDGTVGQVAFYNTSGTTRTSQILGLRSGANNSGALTFQTNNAGSLAERMRIDSDGNVGIGSTSSGNKFEVAGSGMFSGAVTTNTTGTHISYQSSNSQIGAWGPDASTNGTLVFYSARSNGSNGLERMRITSGGNLLVGTSSVQNAGNAITCFGGFYSFCLNSGSFNYYFGTDSNNFNVYSGDGVLRGYLGTAGAWTNTSDIAFKKDIVDIKYSLQDALNLRPVSYLTKDYEIPQIGFIAQEMEQVIPEVVSGEEGSKGISYGSLVALCVKAIQELKAELDATKAEVQALKGVA